jgi:hypothetical protein
MILLLVDTCVWLDIAKSPNDEPILSSIETLVEQNVITLLAPEIITKEFARNKDRVRDDARKRLTQEFKKVRKAIELFGADQNKSAAIGALDDVNHRLPILSEQIISSITRIEMLFQKSKISPITQAMHEQVGIRGLEKKAPFHKNKNSIADALLMEVFHEESNKPGIDSSYFVTLNINDFSSPTDGRLIHSDYAAYFADGKTTYTINIADLLKEIDPELTEEIFLEHEWDSQTRSLSDIVDSINEFEQKIWYGRHRTLANNVQRGKTKVVEQNTSKKYNPNVIIKEIWEGALAAAKEVEEKYQDDLGPWDSFEWGMLNGKLSALRWILGDEWDMLDT